jgi:hypothetical protein
MEFKTYIKKPVVIEAMQFNLRGKTDEEIQEFFDWCADGITGALNDPDILEIKTLKGVMKANVNDWIIKGVNGEFYPCKPDIFKETYERIDDVSQERNIYTSFEARLEMVKEDGLSLGYFPESLRSYELSLVAIKENEEAFFHVPNELRDFEICSEVLKRNEYMEKFITSEMLEQLEQKAAWIKTRRIKKALETGASSQFAEFKKEEIL